jgi:hypothetical protein
LCQYLLKTADFNGCWEVAMDAASYLYHPEAVAQAWVMRELVYVAF